MRKLVWLRLALACAAAAVVAFSWDDLRVSAQSSPASLPLLSESGLSYLGGFRVPTSGLYGADFSYGGKPIAFNPANNSLFIGNLSNKIAEIGIPTPVINSDPTALPTADFLQQGLVDPTEGHLGDITSNSISLSGLLVYGNRLYGSAVIYYDAINSQRVSHFSRALELTQPSFSGWSEVWETGRAGFVGGMMSLVPAEWQSLLGGPAITGQCCLSIISRTSFGPAAFAFDPAQVGQATIPAHPLVYYPMTHPTLGPWDSTNPTYGAATSVNGVAIIAGTRTVLFVGSNGVGPYCYGEGTSDQAAADASGGSVCYDPTSSAKGQHAYPYRYQVWAYDLNDFAAVKAGSKQPWEVVPYGVWPITFPTPEPSISIGGVAYDPQRQILYVSQLKADQMGYNVLPIIHAFSVDAAPEPEAPAPSLTSAVSLTADKAAPQAIGNAVEFSARPIDGIAPYQYKWLLFDGVSSKVLADWTTSGKYLWTPTSGNPNYRVGVWVRGAGNTADALEASTSMPFAISDVAGTSSVALTTNRLAPQAPFTTITWTATPADGLAPHQYKWFVSDGVSSTLVADWSATNSYLWTPSTANANYRLTVWVRGAGNTVDAQEAFTTSMPFPIETAVPPPVPAPVSSVAISANKTAPRRVGSVITWNAVATGGTAPVLYKWSIFNGSEWIVVTGWRKSPTYTWRPTAANAGYRVGVWAKRASNPADALEASTSTAFPIQLSATPVSAPVSRVEISANKAAPQAPSAVIIWNAVATGGRAPLLYKWSVFDGANWIVMANWSASATYTWTPAAANSGYLVAVWAKAASNSADAPEASTSTAFPIIRRPSRPLSRQGR